MVPCIGFPLHYGYVILMVALIAVNYGAIASSLQQESNENPRTRNRGFKTEPNFIPQTFKHLFKTKEESPLSPGYIFIALMRKKPGKWGPRIYDYNGDLIWDGSPSVGTTRITDFHPCDLGTLGMHLCWHDQIPDPSPTSDRSLIKKIFVDNKYSLLHNYTTRGNSHEFHIVENGTRFVSMDYRPKLWDLRPYCGAQDGWIEDACIVEYDVQTGKQTWDWCFTDYLPVHESNVYFVGHKDCQTNDTSPKAGRGTKKIPWDFGHLNAVDKDMNGDYIASFRHLNEIMKIAGPGNTQFKTGTIIWRLGGRGNQFEMNFTFSRQHMVRFVDRTTIAIFNNAWEGYLTPSANASSGQVIRLDTDNMKAELLHQYPHPHDKLAASRGSMEVLPNGNAFIGWGNLPDISEYSPNGTLVFYAQFAPYKSKQYSYRAFKSPWVGNPSWPPKLVAFSKFCGKKSPLFAYASWNGATEVRQWRFRTASTKSGPWISAGTFNKIGFETQVRLNHSTAAYVSVEALDANGAEVGKATEATFIPGPALKRICDAHGCPDQFVYEDNANHAHICNRAHEPLLIPLAVFIILIECYVTLVGNAIRKFSTTGE